MNQVKIIYGTAWKKQRTTDLVVQAVLNGFRAIDTACQPKHYREDLVGEALSILNDKHGIRREELHIQTKYTPIGGQDRNQPIPYDPSASITDQVTQSFLKSLANLRTTYVDSYILHSPLSTIRETVEAWHVLIKLKQEGRARAIGVSNTYDLATLEALEEATRISVDVVQNRWYEDNKWDHEVLQYCRERNIQYQSFWTLTGSPSLLSHASTLSLAQSSSSTPEQLIYRLAQSRGITPLCGTTNDRHMREALAAQDIEWEEESSDVIKLAAFMAA